MRSVFATAFAAVVGLSSSQSCQSLCDGVADCREDPHAHGSYCKTWQTPQVCFGLYWTDASESDMCFQPNASGACPENNPVRCPAAADRCQTICDNTLSCASDPHAHGSYCKSWQTAPSCFGLYYTDATFTATCFQPVDGPSCSEEFPVGCDDGADVTTTAAPVTESVATTAAPVPTEAPVTTAAPATTVATTARVLAAARAAPVTTARPTTSTAPATTVAAVAGPTGIYRGNALRGAVEMSVDFTPRAVTIVFAAFGTTHTATDIPYTQSGDRLTLTECPAMTAFLTGLPMPVTISQIAITYVAASDEVRGSFAGISIVGRK